MTMKTTRHTECKPTLMQNALLLAVLVALVSMTVSCTQQPEATSPQPYRPEDVLVAQTAFLMEQLDEWDAPATPAQVDAFIAAAEAAWAKEARQNYPDYERLLSPLYGALLAPKLYAGRFTPEQWRRQGRLMCYALEKYTLPLLADEFAYLKSEPNEKKAQWLIGTASALSLREQCSLPDEQRALVDSLRREYPAVIDTYLNSPAAKDSMMTLFLTSALSDVMDTIGERYLQGVPDGFEDRVHSLGAYDLRAAECAALLRRDAHRPEARFVRVHVVEQQPSRTAWEMPLQSSGERLALQQESLFDLSSVKRAQVSRSLRGDYSVSIEFTNEGAACLHHLTKANVGKRLGIIIDDRLVRAPRLLAPLPVGDFPLLETVTQRRAESLAVGINEKVEQLRQQQ
ncbi:hypothetical protein AWN76_012685 [Rhodothermaceae bacterium RA]|nr:hypothetical protein AWN76_012685 [Rhodothermaceae bacterium RA]